ncbi:MAG: TlpA family protein disulfide reductase [Bryobacterales bacterium]|nr:TlpA family protein disulfide reductase [Bryobacterales bacterium]
MKTDRILHYLLAASVAVFAVVLWDALRDRVVNVGDTAPNFSITTESGLNVSRSNFGGKLLVLNFWATWCPPCVRETPALEALHNQLKDSGVVVLGVSLDKNEKKYKDFLKRFRVTYAMARDEKGELSGLFGTYRYPETYVIDRNGKVVQKIIGAEWTVENMSRYLKSLL